MLTPPLGLHLDQYKAKGDAPALVLMHLQQHTALGLLP